MADSASTNQLREFSSPNVHTSRDRDANIPRQASTFSG